MFRAEIHSYLDSWASLNDHARMASRATSRRGKKGAGPDVARLIHVRLPEAVHRALRVHVAAQDTSIQDWVAALIARELGSSTVNTRSEGGRRK
jgi:predicted HicB family RNase H-like nuclease